MGDTTTALDGWRQGSLSLDGDLKDMVDHMAGLDRSDWIGLDGSDGSRLVGQG